MCTQWTRKLLPPLLDAVKVKVFFCWSNSDIMANTNANILQTMCTLILKLSHLNIVHRVFVVLIAVTVCLKAGVTVFVSTVCTCACVIILFWKLSSREVFTIYQYIHVCHLVFIHYEKRLESILASLYNKVFGQPLIKLHAT